MQRTADIFKHGRDSSRRDRRFTWSPPPAPLESQAAEVASHLHSARAQSNLEVGCLWQTAHTPDEVGGGQLWLSIARVLATGVSGASTRFSKSGDRSRERGQARAGRKVESGPRGQAAGRSLRAAPTPPTRQQAFSHNAYRPVVF